MSADFLLAAFYYQDPTFARQQIADLGIFGEPDPTPAADYRLYYPAVLLQIGTEAPLEISLPFIDAVMDYFRRNLKLAPDPNAPTGTFNLQGTNVYYQHIPQQKEVDYFLF